MDDVEDDGDNEMDDVDAEIYQSDLLNVAQQCCSPWNVDDWVTVVYDNKLFPG